MAYETIILDVADGIATVTLNRPGRMNSFNRTMAHEFRALWLSLRTDPEVRVIVLRALPGKAFSTGADVKEGWRAPGERDAPFDMDDPGEWLGPKSNKVWKPVIVAVSGMAAGGAFYWLNQADMIICSEEATFFDPHVTFGMVSAVEPVGAFGRMPLFEILRMVLLGNDERISAQTALKISLVTEVTTLENLWGRAAELAALIAAKPPAAIQGTVRAIWEAQDLPHAAAVANALKYTQLGNPIGKAEVDRATTKTPPWKLR
jgi:enoyl-CoA hydratase/carnithine racemase